MLKSFVTLYEIPDFNILEKLWMSFTLDETVTKVIIETMIVISHACRDIYMRIMVTLGFRTCLSNTY